MKAITEKLSRAKNAEDAKNTMNINPDSLSPRHGGEGQGEEGHARRAVRSGNPSPQSSTDHPGCAAQRRVSRDEGRGSLSAGVFTLTAIAAALLFATPAHAQVAPGCTGANPGVVQCPGPSDDPAGPAIYADGILHDADGGNITVNVGEGVTSFGTGGFNTAATGNDSITMTKGNSPTMSAVAGVGTSAATIIGATTENGDISITTGTGNLVGVVTDTRYGIRAVSTGSGDIGIVAGGGVDGFGQAINSIAGIDASTNGGDISISAAGAVSGRQYGIRAHANGGEISITTIDNNNIYGGDYGIEAVTTGDISLSLGDANTAITGGGAGVFTDTRGGSGTTTLNISRSLGSGALPVGLIARTGTGALTINLDPNGSPATGSYSNFTTTISEIVTSGGGETTINVVDNTIVNILNLSPDAGVTATVNNTGRIGDNVSNVWGRGSGAGDILVINDERLLGRVDYSAATGSVTIINNSDRPRGRPSNGGWRFSGVNAFGSGNDQIINSARAALTAQRGASIDFGAGDDVLVNNGRFMVGEDFLSEGAVTLSNLERFENSGLIIMGLVYRDNVDQGLTSNLMPGTRLIVHGVDFIAGEGSRIALDAALSDIVQADCTAAPAADCLDFTGGTTSGTTLLTLSDARPAVSSAAFNEGIVLIEGASAAEHFVLDPNSRGYVANTSTGPAIQKGLVTYRFTYDEDAKQHKLTGVLADEGMQGGTFMAAAQEIWRTTTDTWFDRQVALRSQPQSGREAGLWSSINMSTGERDLMRALDIGANSYDYNLKQDQQITHLAFGGDIVNGGSGDTAWSFGGMAGYVYSTIDYDATKLQSEIGGFAAGFYGSYLAGPLSVDALLNYNLATQSLDAHNLGLGPDTQIRTDLESIGGRVDAGWRFTVSDAFYVQPLIGAAYVTTTIDDLKLPSNGGAFAFDGTSLRMGAGLRMGLESKLGSVKAIYDLTGRWWNELEGDNGTVVSFGSGPVDVPVRDDFSGGFSEVAAGVNLVSAGGGFSGYLNLKSKFASDYSTVGASAGFRYQW